MRGGGRSGQSLVKNSGCIVTLAGTGTTIKRTPSCFSCWLKSTIVSRAFLSHSRRIAGQKVLSSAGRNLHPSTPSTLVGSADFQSLVEDGLALSCVNGYSSPAAVRR